MIRTIETETQLKVLEENITKWLTGHSCDILAKIWLFSALVLRVCLHLNLKVIKNFFGGGGRIQDCLMSTLLTLLCDY